jgi:separase
MHDSLLLLYPHEPCVKKARQTKTTTTLSAIPTLKEHLLSLPLASGILDASLSKLLVTYLLHSLTAFTSAGDLDLNHLADILSQPETLNAWIPTCSSLPTDYVDSICTRAYTALTKFVGLNSQSSPRAVFNIRIYSVQSLLCASTSVIPPDTFWDQVTKFAMLFIRGNRNDETSLSQVVLDAFSCLVNGVEQRSDKDTFFSGKGFVKFCEYWIGFAKKVRRALFFTLHTINVIPE